MSIRNVNLGGQDWINGEVLYAADLNDTFDEVATLKIPWFINTTFNTVYDAFTTEVSATNWTYTETDSGAVSWSDTNNAFGDAQGEAKILTSGTGSVGIESKNIPANRSVWCRIVWAISAGAGGGEAANFIVSFNGTNYTIKGVVGGGTGTTYSALDAGQIFQIVNTATDTFDVYFGAKRLATGISRSTDTNIKIFLESTGGSSYAYIDDVRYSNW